MSNPVPTYGQYWPIAANYWDEMSIRASRTQEVEATARKLLKHKARYQTIEHETGVPWYMVAVLHERESNANFERQLGQGDRLDRKSVNAPKGRGPFKDFEASAYDALVTLKHYDKIEDWRLEKILYYSEKYNGWGYWQYHGKMPSPYIWGATSVQTPGKYVADGKWSSTTMDQQVGCAAML